MWYHSFPQAMRERFGGKVYKLALDGGMTCPNRDGTLGTRGCIFCSEVGAGEFASPACTHVAEQLAHAKQRVAHKNKGGQYIAYFQSFTNTYAPSRTWTLCFARQSLLRRLLRSRSPRARTALGQRSWPFCSASIKSNPFGWSWDCKPYIQTAPVTSGAGTRCRSMITQSAHSKEPAWK